MAREKSKEKQEGDALDAKKFAWKIDNLVSGFKSAGLMKESRLLSDETVKLCFHVPPVKIGKMRFTHLLYRITLNVDITKWKMTSGLSRDEAYIYDDEDLPHPHMHTIYNAFCADSRSLEMVHEYITMERYHDAALMVSTIAASYNSDDTHRVYPGLVTCHMNGCDGDGNEKCFKCGRRVCGAHLTLCAVCNDALCFGCAIEEAVDGLFVYNVCPNHRNEITGKCECGAYLGNNNDTELCYECDEVCGCSFCNIGCCSCSVPTCDAHSVTALHDHGIKLRGFCLECVYESSYHECSLCEMSMRVKDKFAYDSTFERKHRDTCMNCESIVEQRKRRELVALKAKRKTFSSRLLQTQSYPFLLTAFDMPGAALNEGTIVLQDGGNS